MIGITFALPVESADLRRLLTNCVPAQAKDNALVHGEWHGQQIALLHTGVGARVCQRRLKDFFERERVRCLISSGFAGALTDRFKVGDLFVAENFSSRDLVAAVRNLSMQVQFGKLATVPRMVESAAERRDLSASSDADAVDMETECIAQACAFRDLPLLSLRAISDTPAIPFPAPSNILFNIDRQKMDLAALTLYLTRHPSALLGLGRFSRGIARARRALTDTIGNLVESGAL